MHFINFRIEGYSIDFDAITSAIGADKVQLFKPHFDQAMIDKAHEHGIICNVFWSDDPEEARRFFDMGIDTVLTNDYLNVYNGVRDYLK